MPDKVAKAAYDKARRLRLSDELRAYDRERNRARRMDPAYRESHAALKRAWRKSPEVRQKEREWERAYVAVNLHRRIAKNLRNRLSKAASRGSRRTSAVTDLGMTMADFRTYIETKFQPGMTWDNYGEWHLDHIRPLASFDLSDEAQAREACHYSNIQPLWALDNQRKWKSMPHDRARFIEASR